MGTAQRGATKGELWLSFPTADPGGLRAGADSLQQTHLGTNNLQLEWEGDSQFHMGF